MTSSIYFDIQNYWDAQPCNVRHSSSQEGTDRWSDEVIEKRYISEPHIEKFAAFQTWCGCRVLEIGCGIGTDTLRFARAGALIDAVDFSGHSISLAEQRSRHRYLNARFYLADAENWLPGGPDEYDLIYSYGVLHHTPRPDKILQQAWDRLSPRGELRLMVYARGSLKQLQGWQPEAQANCPLVRHYTRASISRLLAQTGYQVIRIERCHIFKFDLVAYRNQEYRPRLLARVLGNKNFLRLSYILGEHLLVWGRKVI